MQMQVSYNDAHAKIESDQYLIADFQSTGEEAKVAKDEKY